MIMHYKSSYRLARKPVTEMEVGQGAKIGTTESDLIGR